MPNEANAHKQFLKDVTNATRNPSCPTKFHCFSKVLKLMWTEVWKVWFHQTAQSEAAAKSEIQCNKCSLNANIYEATTSSRPGQAEEKFLVSVASATGNFWKSTRDSQC